MNYYQLTDPLRSGQIIREDGRKHFRFVFGSYQWERTTLFQAYLTEGTPFFGKYCSVSEEKAMELLKQYGRNLAGLLQKADAIAEKAHAGQVCKGGEPYIEHPRTVAENLVDWEEKIVALLHDVCEDTPWTVKQLQAEGFPTHLCLAIDLLTKKEGQSYQATDYNTGTSFMLTYAGGANHAEVECTTAADSATVLTLFGGEYNFSKRAVTLLVGGRQIAASMQAYPHGSDTVAANDVEGHFCLFFENSLSHVGSLPDSEHQELIYRASGR